MHPNAKKVFIAALVASGGIIAYSSLNTEFNLILPDGAEIDHMILSFDNFSNIKQNVGVFTVYQPMQTSTAPTTGYCKVAAFIHKHEDGYNSTHVGNSTIEQATIPPAWCDPELHPVTVPEFPSGAIVSIFVISVMGFIIYASKTFGVFR